VSCNLPSYGSSRKRPPNEVALVQSLPSALSISGLSTWTWYKGNGCRKVAIVTDTDFAQLSVKLIYIYRCSINAVRCLSSFLTWLICCDRGFVWGIKNKALGPCGLMFVARSRSGGKDHDALKGALGGLEVLASFANSFLCSKPERPSDTAAADNEHVLPASKELRHAIQV
jgi:hypothetical protein